MADSEKSFRNFDDHTLATFFANEIGDTSVPKADLSARADIRYAAELLLGVVEHPSLASTTEEIRRRIVALQQSNLSGEQDA